MTASVVAKTKVDTPFNRIMPNAREHTRATLAGKIGAVELSIAGLRGVFRRLAGEHHTVGELLGLATDATDPAHRKDLWWALRDELRVHEHAELRAVYPAFNNDPYLRILVEVHETEAAELEGLLAELDDVAGDSPDWRVSMERLYFSLHQHVRREEEFIFPRLQDSLSGSQAKDLERQYAEAHEHVLAELGVTTKSATP